MVAKERQASSAATCLIRLPFGVYHHLQSSPAKTHHMCAAHYWHCSGQSGS